MSSRMGLRISIFDDGCGMDQQQCKRAFEPFFSTKLEKGTGLGLWIARAIALRNGGRITLRSTRKPETHFTCISIFFPDSVALAPAAGLTAKASERLQYGTAASASAAQQL
jgi:signal transduction histidine kinase